MDLRDRTMMALAAYRSGPAPAELSERYAATMAALLEEWASAESEPEFRLRVSDSRADGASLRSDGEWPV
jgi:hypothetical protein